MKKITSLFYTLFIILLLSACADVAAQTISSDDTEPNEQQINSNATSSSESNSLVSELESLIGLLRNQVTELKNQNNTLDNQIQSLNNKIDELKEENMSIEDDISSLNSEIAGFTNKNTEFIVEISNLEEEITELENKSIELNDKIEYLEDEIVVGTTSNYNKVGKFYEKEVDGMVDYYNYNKSHEVAGMYFYLNYPDKDIVFRVHSDSSDFISPPNGSGERASNYIEITPDPNGFLFYVDEDTSKLEDAVVSWCWAMNTIPKDYYFMDVIIMKDDNILGFVVLKMIDRLVELPVGLYNATTLKSVVLPKIGDEYQNVTLEQVNLAINEVILLNTPVEEE